MMINSFETENLPNLARCDFLDICLLGETGTGKTHTARLIHELSPRKDKPFVAINCAELSASIIESELFGYEKGAFTGAVSSKTGKFEAAAGGTLFLDEIGEFNNDMQAKLLKVVDEKCITRVGSVVPRSVDLRIIYATNRDLSVFREDLRYRIAAYTLKLKPLRERPEEIVPLANQFVTDFSRKSGSEILVGKNALQVLCYADWGGNVRELRSFIEKVCLDSLFCFDRDKPAGGQAQITELTAEILLSNLSHNQGNTEKNHMFSEKSEYVNLPLTDHRRVIQEYDRQLIEIMLKKNNGNVSRTAVALGFSRYGLIKKIKRYGIKSKGS